MAINLFSNYRNNNNILQYNSKEVTQPVTQNKSEHKLAKMLVPATVGGIAAGGYAYSKQNRNINMKYAIFAKNELKKVLNDPIANRPCYTTPFRSNPISNYKGLKRVIAGVNEDLPICTGKVKLDLESIKIEAQQLLNNHKIRFMNIHTAFKIKLITQTINKILKYGLLGMLLGAASGVLLSKLTQTSTKKDS